MRTKIIIGNKAGELETVAFLNEDDGLTLTKTEGGAGIAFYEPDQPSRPSRSSCQIHLSLRQLEDLRDRIEELMFSAPPEA